MLDEVNSDLKDDFDNLMNNSNTEFVLEERLDNELDSDYELLNSLVNYQKLIIKLLKIQLLKKFWKKVIAKLKKN